MVNETHCARCGADFASQATPNTTGYGSRSDGSKICFRCCGVEDAERMTREDRASMYWDGAALTNWPGTLRYAPVKVRQHRANWHHVGVVTTIYFRDASGRPWSARHAGWAQIAHCRRISERAFSRAVR